MKTGFVENRGKISELDRTFDLELQKMELGDRLEKEVKTLA